VKTYKEPDFRDRVSRASEAKSKALAQLRSRPPKDESVIAARLERSQLREEATAAKRAGRNAAAQVAKDEKAAASTKKKAAAKPLPTEAERKAARDARYAARKNRR
jgi:hypothetical protein